MQGLSILIPTYNNICVDLVKRLSQLCDAMPQLPYEIVVGDDCSTDMECRCVNAAINAMDHCTLLQRQSNGGSAVTRNHLASSSRYEWLLFLDSDVEIGRDDFIERYWNSRKPGTVVNGGVAVADAGGCAGGNLRRLYESNAAPRHVASERSKRPYKSFRSANFMVPRSIMLANPFDERMRRFEDVYWGKVLRQQGVEILHIDNPVLLADFEGNEAYMRKIEKDIGMLHAYRQELRGYSTMLTVADSIGRSVPLPLLRLWHRIFGPLERRVLVGSHPCLKLFNLYRIGYFITYNHKTIQK